MKIFFLVIAIIGLAFLFFFMALRLILNNPNDSSKEDVTPENDDDLPCNHL